MTPARDLLAERIVIAAGFVAMVVAVGAFDWRAGLLLAGLLLVLSALDMPRRRP
jgi:hypothetical protein